MTPRPAIATAALAGLLLLSGTAQAADVLTLVPGAATKAPGNQLRGTVVAETPTAAEAPEAAYASVLCYQNIYEETHKGGAALKGSGNLPGQKEKPEKELFEKLQDKGFDKNQEKGFEVPTPGADGSGVAERLAQLEQSVAALSHFISADLRPDMGASALSREQDLQALSEGMAAQSEAAKASKDVRDVS